MSQPVMSVNVFGAEFSVTALPRHEAPERNRFMPQTRREYIRMKLHDQRQRQEWQMDLA